MAALMIAVVFLGVSITAAQFPPQVVETKLGEEKTLPCLVPSGETKVSWYMNNIRITFGMTVLHGKRYSIQRRSNEWNLRIDGVTRDDETTFKCEAGTTVIVEIRLEIQTGPTWNDISPHELTPMEHTDVTITCMANGRPTPEITWYTENMPSPNQKQKLEVTGDKLVIYNISRYQSDTYSCLAANAHGELHHSTKISVKFPPEVYIYEREVVASLQTDIVFTCVVQGYPVDKVYWETNNKVEIKDPHWKYKLFREQPDDYPVTFLTLMIHKYSLSDYDYGTYMCIAEGESPEDRRSAEVVLLKEEEKKTDEETVIKYN